MKRGTTTKLSCTTTPRRRVLTERIARRDVMGTYLGELRPEQAEEFRTRVVNAFTSFYMGKNTKVFCASYTSGDYAWVEVTVDGSPADEGYIYALFCVALGRV
jgi:hypothetical protein